MIIPHNFDYYASNKFNINPNYSKSKKLLGKKNEGEIIIEAFQSIQKILFLHGFTSGGNCEIAHTLTKTLEGVADVVCPDLPLHPTDALEMVRHLCVTERPCLIIGSSCDAFYAQQAVRTEGIPALLINPFFMMSEFLEPPREDVLWDDRAQWQMYAEISRGGQQ